MFGKKKKLKGEIKEDGSVVFYKNDPDGLTAQDAVVVASLITFFGGIAVGLIVTLVGMFTGYELPDKYIELIKTMDLTMSVVLGGLFANKAVQSYVNSKPRKKKEEVTEEESDI